jgi:dUTP pyrophosphatase
MKEFIANLVFRLIMFVMVNARTRVRVVSYADHFPFRYRTVDAGFDLPACESGSVMPGECKAFDTGIVLDIPRGMHGVIKARQGLAVSHNIYVALEETLDSGLTRSIKVILHNRGFRRFYVNSGDRIAQLVFGFTLPAGVKWDAKINCSKAAAKKEIA